MKLEQMRLSQTALGKFSQLAMAVELHEHKRFSLRKDIDQVVGLLKVATLSSNSVIQAKLNELGESLTEDTLGFFRTLGIELISSVKPVPAVKGQRTYRGQVVINDPIPAKTTPEVPKQDGPKKKIIYRGKVIYR